MLTGAQRILEGEIPLKDFFYVQIPGDLWLLALFFKIFGKSFGTAKAMMLFFLLLSGWLLISWLYRQTGEKSTTVLFALLYFSFFFSYFELTHHWLGTFFVVFTMILFINGLNREDKIYIFLSGLSGGLTFLISETRGMYILASYFLFLLFLAFKKKQFKKLAFSFFTGSIIVLSGYFCFVVSTGSLRSHMDTILWSFTHYNKFNSYPFLYTELLFIKQNFNPSDIKGFYYALFMIFLILDLLLIPAIIIIKLIIEYPCKIYKGEKPHYQLSLIIICLTFSSLFLSALYRPDNLRLIKFISPVTLLLIL